MGEQKKKRHYPKKTSTGAVLQPPEGYYARKAYVPKYGADLNVIHLCRDQGLQVFAIQQNSKFPIRGSHGHNDAICHTRHVPEWWFNGFDEEFNCFWYNFAIATGQNSNLTVIDLDGVQGQISLGDLEELVGEPLPKTPTVSTPRGGKHLYFKYTPLLKTCVFSHLKVDVRNNSGYVVAPSSRIVQFRHGQYDRESGECRGLDGDGWLTGLRNIESHKTFYSAEYSFDHSFYDYEIAELPDIYAKTLLFMGHHPTDIRHGMAQLSREDRLRHIELWHQGYLRNPRGKVIGIVPQHERDLQRLIQKTTDTPVRPAVAIPVKAIKAIAESAPESCHLPNTPPTFAFPAHLFPPMRPTPSAKEYSPTLAEFRETGQPLYKMPAYHMIEGDGRNNHLTSVGGRLWHYLNPNHAYRDLLLQWMEYFNTHYYKEPLDESEAHKIFRSVSRYEQFPKLVPSKNSTAKRRKSRPHNNVTDSKDPVSKAIIKGAYQVAKEGIIEKIKADPRSGEIHYYTYSEGDKHLLLPILQTFYPDMKVEEISKSHKQTFAIALGKIFQWGRAVPQFKGHRRISTQFGYRLNLAPTTKYPTIAVESSDSTTEDSIAVAPEAVEPLTKEKIAEILGFTTAVEPVSIGSTSNFIVESSHYSSVKEENAVVGNFTTDSTAFSSVVEPSKVDPSKILSLKQFNLLLERNKGIREWWKNRTPSNQRCYNEVSVGSGGRQPFRVVPDWRSRDRFTNTLKKSNTIFGIIGSLSMDNGNGTLGTSI